MAYRCPNCESKMDEGDVCPECCHTEREWCDCQHCEEEDDLCDEFGEVREDVVNDMD